MTKRKRKPGSKKKKTGLSQSRPPIHDRRSLDQTMASIRALLESQEFESIDEANAILQGLLKDGGTLPPPPAETPLQKAQAVMYQAFDAHGRQRIKLARKALTISPDCADAYVLLAEEDARSLEKASAYYAQGMQAGRRALGPEVFQDGVGHFWGIVETRPFMRALAGYAGTLWQLGDHKTSVAHQQEMLRLNPGDNQGGRYLLAHCLLDLERFAELEGLFKEYADDISAELIYPRALAAFLKDGPSARANRRLKQAIEANPYVPAYLLGEKQIPRHMPEYYGLGDENEAIFYAVSYGGFWAMTLGALEWLETMRKQAAPPGSERQGDFEGDAWQDDEDWDQDDEWEGDEEGDGFPAFQLDRFLVSGGFPKTEHGSIRRCLAIGIGKFYTDIYGYEKYGKQPDFLIDERMHVPYLFGYGAVEVIRHKRLRPASKLAVCRYALEIMEPYVEGGIPYGMLTLLGYMATRDDLEYNLLLMVAAGLGFGASYGFARTDWLEGTARDEMLALIDWIAASEEIPADEKLWWAWRLGVQSHDHADIGKTMANRWLSLDTLSPEAKLVLCHGWLENKSNVGEPPVLWQMSKAASIGNVLEFKRLAEASRLKFPSEFDETLAKASRTNVEPETGSVESMLALTHDWMITPPLIHRLAIPALVRLGEDLDTTIDLFWDFGGDYYINAHMAGVADTIREFSDRLPPERLRELVERGLAHSHFQTRKAFYMLSEEYYGDEYLERALQDNAASLRKWAAKKLDRRG